MYGMIKRKRKFNVIKKDGTRYCVKKGSEEKKGYTDEKLDKESYSNLDSKHGRT